MFSITSAQLDLWIASFIYPLTRILALAATAPFLSNAGMPRRVRLMLGIALTVGIAPILPPMPAVTPASGLGLWILAQQVLIGVGMGVSMRLIFTAIDMASAIIAFQMGLGFATFYDPQSTAQTSVISNFMTLLASLLFISLNGHLIYFAVLAQSFNAIPISASSLDPSSWKLLASMGGKIFSTGLLLSLPVIVVLLITNLALGTLNRAAPQLNLFAIGFPITLTLGFVGIILMLGYIAIPLEQLFNEGLHAMLYFALPNPPPPP